MKDDRTTNLETFVLAVKGVLNDTSSGLEQVERFTSWWLHLKICGYAVNAAIESTPLFATECQNFGVE